MNRNYYFAAVLFVLACLSSTLHAQTLTETLAGEDAGKLIIEARERGNIVRGAILFHQGNINCSGCHKPTVGAARIGPDLSRLGEQVTDASIVESVLYPSKTISKGHETRSALTLDGRVLSGVLMSEDPARVVLYNAADAGKRIAINRDDIDELKISPKSTMPDGLANVLKGRQQFLDLLVYVLDVKERGPTIQNVVATGEQRQLSDALHGRVLISKFNCVGCHDPRSAESKTQLTSLAAMQAPDLRWSASRLDPAYLTRFIADPQSVKPGSMMPHLLGQLEAAERKDASESIVHFLTSLKPTPKEVGSTPGNEDLKADSTASDRGFELFNSAGCVACHSPRDRLAVEMEDSDAASIPLGNLTAKYSVSALTEFLEHPHRARPSGQMPNMRLSHREALDLSAYLLQAHSERNSQTNTWSSDANRAEQGKRLFAKSGCTNCHTGILENQNTVQLKGPALSALNPAQGCLSDRQGGWPNYNLTGEQNSHIRAALSDIQRPLTESDEIDVTLVAFNCTACHDRDNLGGVTSEKSPHFQTTNLNLGEQGRIPPTLSGVGAKLNQNWMRDVMVNGRSIRPYMKTRMPQFGEQNIGHIVKLMQSTDQLEETVFSKIGDEKETRNYGHVLAGSKGLNCVACHTFQYKLSDTMPAVDLTEMAQRLKQDWFYQYMLRPQAFSPNTVMPSFWPSGKAIRSDLEGTPEDQVQALWLYLLDGRQARAPAGVIREPLEIVVTDEARMLRRRYPGMASKRGIGVGYPGGVNLAFDAEQMRLAMIWKGKFADPSGVWYGQGHGSVRPMGQPLSFPTGPELDWIANASIVDDETRPIDHQFNGYTLDEQRRPILEYSFDSIQVTDSFKQQGSTQNASVQFQRTVEMTSDKDLDQLRFRIAVEEEITAIAESEFQIGKRLSVRVLSRHSVNIVKDSNGATLLVPLTFQANKPQCLILEYHWE